MTVRRTVIRWGASALAVALIPAAVVAQRATRDRTVVVSAVTNQGAPVTDLTIKDFVVRENGVAREVTRVGPAPAPTHVAVLIDDSQATTGLAPFVRPAFTSFVSQITKIGEPPQLALWTFGERPTRRVPFTPTVETMQKEIARLFPVTGSGAYFLEAIGEAVAELRKRSAERPVIVAFVSEGGPEFSSQLETQITEGLKSIGASLWVVTLQVDGQSLNSTAARERARVLADTTTRSGGTNDVILTAQALETALGRIASAITSRYAVTYGRPEALIPPDSIDVEVRRPDVRVRATRWAGQ
jgi:hypothetical protein